MKMKAIDALNYIAALDKVVNKEMPGTLTFAIVRNINTLQPEAKVFDEAKMKIIKKYASVDEDGKFNLTEDNHFIFEGNNSEKCENEYKEVLESEIEVNISMVDSSVFEKCDNLTPADLIRLDFMIKK